MRGLGWKYDRNGQEMPMCQAGMECVEQSGLGGDGPGSVKV